MTKHEKVAGVVLDGLIRGRHLHPHGTIHDDLRIVAAILEREFSTKELREELQSNHLSDPEYGWVYRKRVFGALDEWEASDGSN